MNKHLRFLATLCLMGISGFCLIIIAAQVGNLLPGLIAVGAYAIAIAINHNSHD